MEKFVVLADARSGTHFFESIINQHLDIICFHEIFSGMKEDHFFEYLLKALQKDRNRVIPTFWPEVYDEYLTNFFSKYSGYKAVGMDIKYYQTGWVPGLFQILGRRGFKIIHLTRKNILKHAIAWIVHTQRDKLKRNMHETKQVSPVKVQLELSTLIPELERRRQLVQEYRVFLSEDFNVIEICYEDCFDNPELISQTVSPSVLNRVYDFLNIEDRRYDMETPYVKGNPGLLRDLVKNYDELVDFLLQARQKNSIRIIHYSATIIMILLNSFPKQSSMHRRMRTRNT
jgi:hypothetical protein